MNADQQAMYSHHFSAHRESADAIRIEGWNRDGTHDGTLNLTHAAALRLLAALSTSLAGSPYGSEG